VLHGRIESCSTGRVGNPFSFAFSLAMTLLLSGLVFTRTALAVPSFAQQTGMACAQCHTTAYGPALTDYGRQFKLNGYVFGENSPLVPVALMVQGGYTRTSADQPDPPAPQFGTNGQLSVDQVSVFIASRLTQHLGLFAQITYDGIGHGTSWDNLDLRYSRSFNVGNTALVSGVSVNNNPTVQDLWNSTPAWGFPYIHSALAPTPSAGPYMGGLGATVLGATAYVMVNNHFYLEAGGYRGLSNQWLKNLGPGAGSNPNISGVAPYWRAALQSSTGPHSYSVGAFGLDAQVQPDPTAPEKDHYTDTGLDATYQYTGRHKSIVAANASLIHERQNLAATFAAGGADNAANTQDFFSVDLSYAYNRTWVGTVNEFSTSGTTNTALYAPGSVSGSNNGSPDSNGYVLQLEYVPFGKLSSPARPWLNLRLGLQYTGYQKFNGGTTNYNGDGRAAHDNNTLFAFFWVIL